MEYRKLGESNLELSVITYGAWAIGGWMWGGTERKDAIEAIHSSYDLGVTSIDTAPVYGQGLSEEIVGEAIKGIPRDKIQILTKYGMRWDTDKGEYFFSTKDSFGKEIKFHKYAAKESVMLECENSLKRLGTDYIDLYQIHWHDSTTPIEETMEAVSKLIEQGKVRYAGVCNYKVEWMKTAEKVVKLVSNQVPFSMVNRGIENEIVPYCIENKKSILAYSPLQKGLLTGKITTDYKFKPGDHRANDNFFSRENVLKINGFLEKIRPIAESKNATLAQLVINWTIERPGITIALVGARNSQQAVQNAKAINLKLSKEEIDFINKNLYEVEIK
jgi:aryl-alcohol dehydrogenase-like predicted oxidoreductase